MVALSTRLWRRREKTKEVTGVACIYTRLPCVIVMQPYLLRLVASSSSHDDEDRVSRAVPQFFCHHFHLRRPPGRAVLQPHRHCDKGTGGIRKRWLFFPTWPNSRYPVLALPQRESALSRAKRTRRSREPPSFFPDKYRLGPLDSPECAMKR